MPGRTAFGTPALPTGAFAGAAFKGGRATTGPCTGRLTMAGCAGMITLGAWRGCGITMRRGGVVGAAVAARGAGLESRCAGIESRCADIESRCAGMGARGAGAGVLASTGGADRTGGGTATTGRGVAACGAFACGGAVWNTRGVVTGTTVTGGRCKVAGATAPAFAGALLATGVFAGGRLDAGATVTVGRAGGGVDRAIASACFRSRMAFSASPGLDTWERLNPCRGSDAARGAPPEERLPRFTCPRTFSASSSSMELECVFFSVTPTAVRASRMVLLLTSSSLARSLIRTLLIRSFSKTSLRA